MDPFDDLSPSESEPASPSRTWAILGFLILIAGVFAFAWAWPYLRTEHRRIEPWRIVFICAADVVSLLWFINALVSVWMWGEAARPPSTQSNSRRAAWFAIGSLVAAIALDAFHTYSALQLEDDAFTRAVTAPAIVYAGSTQMRKQDVWYTLNLRFTDHKGVEHDEQVRLWHPIGATFPSGLQKDKLESGKEFKYPFPATVRFDPQWPNRCWIDGSSLTNHTRGMFQWMLAVAGLQALGLVLGGEETFRAISRSGRSADRALLLCTALPFAIQVVVLIMIGAAW
jgi:hypothetical protein